MPELNVYKSFVLICKFKIKINEKACKKDY